MEDGGRIFLPFRRRAGGRSLHGATSQITSRTDQGGTQTGRLHGVHNKPGPGHLALPNQHQPIPAAQSFTASNLVLMLSLFYPLSCCKNTHVLTMHVHV